MVLLINKDYHLAKVVSSGFKEVLLLKMNIIYIQIHLKYYRDYQMIIKNIKINKLKYKIVQKDDKIDILIK